jgi:hypothetical protein
VVRVGSSAPLCRSAIQICHGTLVWRISISLLSLEAAREQWIGCISIMVDVPRASRGRVSDPITQGKRMYQRHSDGVGSTRTRTPLVKGTA